MVSGGRVLLGPLGQYFVVYIKLCQVYLICCHFNRINLPVVIENLLIRQFWSIEGLSCISDSKDTMRSCLIIIKSFIEFHTAGDV